MVKPYVGYLKGSAANEVDEATRPHEGHALEAVSVIIREDGTVWIGEFLRLRCRDCDVDFLELDE